MKPRARRVTLAAAVLGAGVVAVLVVLNWSTVRDHVEAWHFQLTRETADWPINLDLPLDLPVIVELEPEPPPCRYRVVTQRFPRRAYVIIRDRAAVSAEDPPTTKTLLVPFGDPAR